MPAGEDRSSARRKEVLGSACRDEGRCRSSAAAALRTSWARSEDEGRRCRARRRRRVVGARRVAPYGPRLGPGTRGGGVGGGGDPWLETTAALGRAQGGDAGERREATAGSGARRRKKLGQRRTGSRRKTTVRLNTHGDL